MRFLVLLLLLTGVAEAKHRKVTVTTSITILGPIEFVGAGSTIRSTSEDVLDSVAAALVGNPDLRRVEVFAYGADAPDHRQQLAEERARRLVAELVARGVEPRRLVARGHAVPPAGASAAPGFMIVRRSTPCGLLTCGT